MQHLRLVRYTRSDGRRVYIVEQRFLLWWMHLAPLSKVAPDRLYDDASAKAAFLVFVREWREHNAPLTRKVIASTVTTTRDF